MTANTLRPSLVTFASSILLGGVAGSLVILHPIGMYGPAIWVMLFPQIATQGETAQFILPVLALVPWFLLCALFHLGTRSRRAIWIVRILTVLAYAALSAFSILAVQFAAAGTCI